MVNRSCKASTVIEMAYLMPVVLLTWMLIVLILFCFYDKNIISGSAYETAVVGSENYHKDGEINEEELIQYFQKRVKGKLLFFSNVSAEIEANEEMVCVTGSAFKRGMKVEVSQSAVLIIPEEGLRKRIILKESIEGIIQ